MADCIFRVADAQYSVRRGCMQRIQSNDCSLDSLPALAVPCSSSATFYRKFWRGVQTRWFVVILVSLRGWRGARFLPSLQ